MEKQEKLFDTIKLEKTNKYIANDLKEGSDKITIYPEEVVLMDSMM